MQRPLPIIVRHAIGLLMVVVGVLKFVKPDFKVAENVTLQAFIDSGWLWPLIGAAEILGGLGLLVKRFTALGIAILAPVVAGILAFAIKFGGEETSVGFLLAAALIYLAWCYRDSYRSLIHSEITPPKSEAQLTQAGTKTPS
jgi:uncharacterized membrane protein YphA (DoxX/SURF4 family)